MMMKAQDIMTTDVVTIRGSATVAEAVAMMNEMCLRALIVERRHEQDAYGIVTVCRIRNPMYTIISKSTAVPDTARTVSRKTTPRYKGRFSTKFDCTRNSRHSKLSSFCVPKSLTTPPADRCRILTASRRITTAIVHRMKIAKPHRGKVMLIEFINKPRRALTAAKLAEHSQQKDRAIVPNRQKAESPAFDRARAGLFR